MVSTSRIVLSQRGQYAPGPYTNITKERFTYVPSLIFLCIKLLAEFPDQVHLLHPTRLNYHPAHDPSDFDIIRALVPDPNVLDPRLWATLVQIYDGLPDWLQSYHIPLDDEYLLLLHGARSGVEDTNIHHLKPLVTLAALDLSSTLISDYGIRSLASTIQWDSGYRGPYCLRILRIVGCPKITNSVFPVLLQFPLLSVVDLRDTKCKPCTSGFRPYSDSKLYDSPLPAALQHLNSLMPLFSSDCYSSLHITSLHHPHGASNKRQHFGSSTPGATQDSVTFFSKQIDTIQLDPTKHLRNAELHPVAVVDPILRRNSAPHSAAIFGQKSRLSDRKASHPTGRCDGQTTPLLTETVGIVLSTVDNQSNVPPFSSVLPKETEKDYVGSIAAMEACERRRADEAAAFYKKLPKSPNSLPKQHTKREFAAPRLVKPLSGDEQLTLYRNPPPWNTTQSHARDIPTVNETAHALSGAIRERKAELDPKKAAKARDAMKALATPSIGRGFNQSFPDFGAQTNTLQSTSSRNPFRRRRPLNGPTTSSSKTSSVPLEPTTQKPLRPLKVTGVKALVFLDGYDPCEESSQSRSFGSKDAAMVAGPNPPAALSSSSEQSTPTKDLVAGPAPSETSLKRISTLRVPELPRDAAKATTKRSVGVNTTLPATLPLPPTPFQQLPRSEAPLYALEGVRRKSLKASDPVPESIKKRRKSHAT